MGTSNKQLQCFEDDKDYVNIDQQQAPLEKNEQGYSKSLQNGKSSTCSTIADYSGTSNNKLALSN